jgi:hypothetical protein
MCFVVHSSKSEPRNTLTARTATKKEGNLMDEAFEIAHREDYVRVKFGESYEPDPEWQDELWERLRTICDEYDTRRVLAEGTFPAPDRPPASVIEAGQRTATIPNLWIAFHFDDFVPTANTELYEVIAASYGVRVKFFNDRDAALKWLRANAPK